MPMGVGVLPAGGKRAVDFLAAVAVAYTIIRLLGAALAIAHIMFFLVLLLGLALLTCIPWISLALVHAFFERKH